MGLSEYCVPSWTLLIDNNGPQNRFWPRANELTLFTGTRVNLDPAFAVEARSECLCSKGCEDEARFARLMSNLNIDMNRRGKKANNGENEGSGRDVEMDDV